MKELLQQNNVALLHEIRKLQRSLRQASNNIPKELKGYTDWITKICGGFSRSVLQNLKYLGSERQDLLEDILSETQKVSREFYVFNERHVSPILRARSSDRLPLKLLLWMHAMHPKTKNIPVAVCDGEFSIWLIGASIYFTPCAAQQGVLNLPLVEKLAHRTHPVTWIRIQLLADRARQMDYNAVADDLENEWKQIAAALGIVENHYYGFYHPTFLPRIQQKLDDMLTETAPREFQALEITEQERDFTSPVALLNSAWLKFRNDPDNYQEWEENAISHFLETDI